MKIFALFLILFLGKCLIAEETMKKDEMKNEAGVQYIQLQNGYHLWTKRVGEGPIKILTLHGGPGFTHEYLECMEDFFPKDRFQLIFYDQLGSYFSDQPNDPSLWTVERFREEVEEVRKALNLNDFYLYGQSWGGLLAIEYALKYQKHLKGLILSNIVASVESYVTYSNHLRRQLPQEIQERLKFYEDKKDYANPEYEKILLKELYAKHLCRLMPLPEPLVRSFQHINMQVYQTIQGPNEFVVTGNFKDWNRWNDLPEIKVPTLLIGAKYDNMNPKDVEKMGTLIPNATVKICEKGSHCAMYDEQETYFQAIHDFLKKCQAGI